MAVAKGKSAKRTSPKTDGTTPVSGNGAGTPTPAQLRGVVKALEAARDGDFSVRLAGRNQDGVLAEIAAAYDELAERNARMEAEMARIGRVVGREGRMTERASLGGAPGGWQESIESVNALIDDLARPTTEVARVIDAVAEGDLSQKMALKIEGKSLQGRVPADRHHGERDGGPARLVRRRGHARRARGRHRGPARRPGAGRGRLRHLARPDREREPARVQPHRPGAKHRRGDHRGRQRRPHARRSPSTPAARSSR